MSFKVGRYSHDVKDNTNKGDGGLIRDAAFIAPDISASNALTMQT